MKYGIVEVLNKLTGEKQMIKWARFNPEIHKQIGDVMEADRMDYSAPVNIQLDPIADAVLAGKKKAEQEAEAKKVAEAIHPEMIEEVLLEEGVEKSSEIVDEEEEKEENTFDETIDRSIEELEQVSRQQLMKYLSHRGQKPSFKSTKQDLLAQVRELII